MTARVELTTRTTRSNSKPARSYITPLSDASNKSSDSSISSSLIIAEDTRGSSKPSSMYGTGLKPRLSPKPFTRERPETKSVGVISTLLIDEEPPSDVPFQTSTNIALFGSTKTEEPERVGRRIVTSNYPLNSEEEQGNKSDLFSPVILRDRKSRSSFVPASESKSDSQDDEPKVTSKPPIMSRRADVSQEQEKVHVGSFRRPSADTSDKQKGSLDSAKYTASYLEAMDSLKVRDQLRPKRRPVSALFLDSASDQTSDNKVSEQRTWNRRPLSEDLTSLFESRGLGNKKESPSEEFKENRPLRKKSFSSNITEEQSDAVTKAGEFISSKSARNETGMDVIGISSRNRFSVRGTKDTTTERKSSSDLGRPIEADNNSSVNRPTNSINTVSKTTDNDDGPTREVKNADGSGTAPVSMRQRLNLFLANTNYSADLADPPASKEAKTAPSIERKYRGNVSDIDTEFGRPRTASQSQAADVVKKFSTSSYVEPRLEKTQDEESVSVSQDYGIQKEQKKWQSSEFSEERPLRSRRSLRKVDEPYPLENNENGLKEKKSYGYSDKTEESENTYKKPARFDNSFKTVKATMFDNKIERHSPPELFSTGTSTPSQPTKSELFCESPEVKHDTESWSKWLSDDSVHVVTQLHKDSEVSDSRFNESRVRKASSSTDHTNALQNFKKVDEKTRIEPRYELVSSSVGERVSSESIKMVPESKAMTLRSQRSFRRREPEESVMDDRNLNRPVPNLQRSKSEIRKKVTPESPQESPTDKRFSRDLDFPIRKYGLKTEKSESPKAPEDGIYKISKNKSIIGSEASDFQQKPYKLGYARKKESALQQDSTEQTPFEAGISDGKESEKSFENVIPYSRTSISDLVVRGSETGPKTAVEDESAAVSSNVRDDIIQSKVEEINKPSYQWNRFFSDKDSPRSKKENKDDSNELIGKILREDIEKIKRDLFVNQPTKEVSVFSTGKQVKEEYTEELRWERTRPTSRDRNANAQGTGNASDLFKSEFEDSSKKQNISTLKDAITTDSKVTYFAVTGVDNKKEKNENNFENQSNVASMWSSDEFYFTRNMRTSITHSALDSNSNKITQGDLEISSTPKELKTHRNQKVLEDIYGSDSIKPSEKPSDDDNFNLRQKSGLDDIIPSYRDLHPKLEQEVNEPPLNTTLDYPIKLDRAYKSKAVDIDSLMAEYRAGQQKETISKDGDRDVPKWEMSGIFRENASKGSSSKWKDPPVKHVSTIESYQSESIIWSSSQDNSSMIESPKQDPHKTSNTGDHMYSLAKHDKYFDKKKEEGFQVRSEKSQNIATLDSLLESSKKHSYLKGRSIQTTESLTVADQVTVTETSVDEPLDNSAVKFSSRSSVKTDRKFMSSEERPPLSEARQTVKNSDLLSRMLERREKRAEQRHTQHNLLVEETQEPRTQRIKSQQEWYHSESKEYFEREDYKSPAKRSQEPDVLAALIRRRSSHRQRERDLHPEEDHIKQCFSRSPTSNKDTDSLVQDPDRQYGTWSPTKQQTEDSCVTESPSYDNSSRKQHSHSRLSSLSHTETDQHDSITEARDGSLDRCSMDLDSTDGTESTPSEAKAADFSFIDQTSVLDSTALKNRVQLNRKSQRRAPSQSQRRSRVLQPSSQLAVIEDTDNPWMYTDTTEEKTEEEQEEEVEIEEEKPKRSSVHSPRMPVFPGMDHSSLMAQLRKRQDAESSSESLAQPTKSPKSPLPHGTIGIKLLPTSADKQVKGTGESPQWMKDLKSKKRQSQYENSS